MFYLYAISPFFLTLSSGAGLAKIELKKSKRKDPRSRKWEKD